MGWIGYVVIGAAGALAIAGVVTAELTRGRRRRRRNVDPGGVQGEYIAGGPGEGGGGGH